MKKIAIVVLLSAVVAAPAVAAGMYAGVSAGSAKINISGYDSTTSFSLLGGYTFNENIAAEVAYSNFGSKDYPLGVTAKSSAVSLSAVGSYPINEQFSLFGKLGLASTTFDVAGVSESKSDLTYGIGAQYNVNKQIGIRVGYDIYKVGSATSYDQSVTSLGGVFKF